MDNDDATLLEVVSLISGIASIILAVLAIALSIVFFRMASSENKDVKKSADGIDASVTRLEKLFDSLYRDTFSIVQDTVRDMREHIYHRVDVEEPGGDAESDEVDPLVDGIAHRLDELLDRAAKTDARIEDLRSEIKPAVERSVTEVREERGRMTADQRMRSTLAPWLARNGPMRTAEVLDHWGGRGFSHEDILSRLFSLRERGILTWDGTAESLTSSTEIRYVPRELRRAPDGSLLDEP